MKRVRLEVIYHVGDSDSEQLLADKLTQYMATFLCPGRGANSIRPHFESCVVSVERSRWEKVT